MKRRALLVALLLCAPHLPTFAATPPKAGSACSKIGITKIFNGKKFTCIKTGKKIVWDKGVDTKTPTPTPPSATPTPTPSPTPIPTPKPSPTTTSTPTPTPSTSSSTAPLSFAEKLWSRGINGVFPIEKETFEISQAVPSNWQDVYEKRLGIPYQAWLAISKNIATNSSKVGKVEILVGPNTVLNFPEITLPMHLISKAFPGAKNVNKLRVFAFNFKDSEWADKKFKELYINETSDFKTRHANAVEEICPKQREVCFQQAFVDSNYDGIIMLGMTDMGSREQLNQTYSEYARATLGVVIAHEYLHTVQRVILGNRWYQRTYTPPNWFTEGSAVFSEGASLNHSSFDAFMRFRAVDSKTLYSDCPYSFCNKSTYEKVLEYLSLSGRGKSWDSFPYDMTYAMSARTIEILVALKGPGSLINFIEYMATEKTFDQAFEFTYGISYEAAKPIIARIIVDQFENGR